MNDRLDFALTVIKWHYNTNDRLKFILLFIRRDNDLNKRLKHVKMEEKKIESERDEDESKQNKR